MPSEKPGIHTGHRARMRSRFFETGLDGFQPHEIIELLLFCTIPKRDVNPLAHALLEKFGSVNALLSASSEEIAAIPGAGRQTGAFFSALGRLADAYRDRRLLSPPSPHTLADFLRCVPPSDRTALRRGVTIIFTDRLNRPLSVCSFPGRADEPTVIRAVLTQALRLHSHSCVIFCTGYRLLHPLERREADALRPLISALAGVGSFTVDCVLLTREHLFSLRRENLLTGQAGELQSHLPRWELWLGPLASADSETGWHLISLIESAAESPGPSSP